MSINKSITFMHISRFILASKLTSTSFTFFTWIFAYIITFFHVRFMYIHTFFHRKIMRGCRLATCLYDIQQTSYERRLHHSRVAPSVPILAEFISTLGNIYPQLIRAATPVLFVCTAPPRLYIGIILLWEIFILLNTHTHMGKIQIDFFRAEPLYVLYIAGKNVKNCKVCSRLCALDPSIFHFIWAKHGGKMW